VVLNSKEKQRMATARWKAKKLLLDPSYFERRNAKRNAKAAAGFAADPDYYKKLYQRQAVSRRRYALKIARSKLPIPTRSCPSLCEVIGCSRKAICLDHEHLTHTFRGWLCQPCNRAASKHHTPESLRALADYLELHS
jgi:Recombination endonuclease VII